MLEPPHHRWTLENMRDLSQLIKSQFPDEVQPDLSKFLEELLNASSTTVQILARSSERFAQSVLRIAALSAFVSRWMVRYPNEWASWSDEGSVLFSSYQAGDIERLLRADLAEVSEEQALMDILRRFRQREMARLIWRDMTGLAAMQETVRDVSELADACISVSLEILTEWAYQKYGRPLSKSGTLQELVVIAMGKLGSRELNVSSDVDLIFAFPESGETDHPDKPIENQTFFVRLGQRLIHVLSQMTSEGFVFRVDMRLRPYGGAGALAVNFNALEDYYQTQGRDWERFAMIKARAITGSTAVRQRLSAIVLPFVYRRYTDFSSIAALRDMKRLIVAEVHRKGGENNIKLGSGGIREIEFVVQACQLIHGGRDTELQLCSMLSVLPVLAAKQYLPQGWVDDLLSANEFLRDMEHAIQGLDDQQTQLIPSDALKRDQVAWALGYDQWQDAQAVMAGHRETIHKLFIEFLSESELSDSINSDENAVDHAWVALWRDPEESRWLDALRQAGFETPSLAWAQVEQILESRNYRSMSEIASQRFETFFVLFMKVVVEHPRPDAVFGRVMDFVRVILGRSIYLVLLYENADALRLLCRLCFESPWVAEHLSHYPSVLDELLDAESLYQPTPKSRLQDELRQTLLRIPEEDMEAQMDALRHFKQSHVLKVAAAELSGKLPLMKVSDYLTWIAEVLVEQCVANAWAGMIEKYGVPGGLSSDPEDLSPRGFAVIGYGKLGGIELNYQSDLDMVFLFDVDDHGSTQGERSINNQVFYTRLGQKVIHLLSTQTSQGGLYEVDMRLRPSGNSGMLVSSLRAFERYQHQDAWTWEHQALVRARFIAGDSAVGQSFNEIRRGVLSLARDADALKHEVVSMREKMTLAAIDKHKNKERAEDDIKMGLGGLVDIEFITQFSVLAYSSTCEGLTEFTDNVRLLEAIQASKCHDECGFDTLVTAYTTLRAALHRKNLADANYRVSLADFAGPRRQVRQIWERVLGV